nr:YncE family protein [Clostridium caldaquaticum]
MAAFKEEYKIPLNQDKLNRVGPHDICPYKDKLLIANSYNNSLSIVDINENKEIESYFIGMHCNGVSLFGDNAYIICGESNCLIVFNLIKRKIIEEIPCESFPHSISIDKEKGIMVIANMQSDSITLIRCSDKENIANIKVAPYPTKAIFTPNGRYVLVCESNMGIHEYGNLKIIELISLKTVGNVKLGNCPVDIYTEENYSYISNFGEGTISVVDIKRMIEVKRIKIGGMPRGIVKEGRNIYIGDNYNNLLVELNLDKENKKVIPIGGEPTGMTLI